MINFRKTLACLTIISLLFTPTLLSAHINNGESTHKGNVTHKNIDIDKEDFLTESADLGDDTKKIREIQSPLSGVPSILSTDDTLRLEVKSSIDIDKVKEAYLKPSFGNARPKIKLDFNDKRSNRSSEIWPDKSVTVLTFDLPDFGDDFKPDLYDAHLKWKSNGNTREDFQPRAVSVKKSIPEDPNVVVVGDPQAGDPRGLTKTFNEAKQNFDGVDCVKEGDKCVGSLVDTLEDLKDNWDETLGNLSKGDRWGSFQKAIQEINAMDPDLVLFPGDMALGAKYSIEFTDAYRLLNQFQVPTYVTPGNHDGITFHFNENDGGLNRWERTFSPLYYSKNIGDNDRIHILSMNTFDWPEGKRKRANIICDASPGAGEWWHPCEGYPAIGGYMSADQLDWVEQDLRNWRNSHPESSSSGGGSIGGFGSFYGSSSTTSSSNEMLITFSHHDPSWKFGNHAWSGIDHPDNQKKIRDELRQAIFSEKVDAHFAGHVHQDRIARFFDDDGDGVGDVIAAAGKRGVKAYDNNGNSKTDDVDIESKIQDPEAGPLFVETTTTGSSTSMYWGWRMVQLDHENTGFTPHNAPDEYGAKKNATKFGYDPKRSFIQNHPVGDGWQYRLAELGLYSYPSYHLNQEPVSVEEKERKLKVENKLNESVTGHFLQPLSACGPVNVTGGEVQWTRTHSGHQDVMVASNLGSKSTSDIKVSIEGNGLCITPIFGSIMELDNSSSGVHPFW